MVVIPWRGFRCFTLQRRPVAERVAAVRKVVIPWRGFRCFTLLTVRNRDAREGVAVVVIPWRGFRCFTLISVSRASDAIDVFVVIPWRGFRCFTPYEDVFVFEFEVVDRCNPLAGI